MFDKFGIPSSFTQDVALMQQLVILLPIAVIILVVVGYKLVIKPFADRHEVEDTLIDMESRIISSTVMRRTQLMNEEAESALFALEEHAPQTGLEGFDPTQSKAPPRIGPTMAVAIPLPIQDMQSEASAIEDLREDRELECIDPIIAYSTDEIDDDLAHIDTPPSCSYHQEEEDDDVWPHESIDTPARRDFRDAR